MNIIQLKDFTVEINMTPAYMQELDPARFPRYTVTTSVKPLFEQAVQALELNNPRIAETAHDAYLGICRGLDQYLASEWSTGTICITSISKLRFTTHGTHTSMECSVDPEQALRCICETVGGDVLVKYTNIIATYLDSIPL